MLALRLAGPLVALRNRMRMFCSVGLNFMGLPFALGVAAGFVVDASPCGACLCGGFYCHACCACVYNVKQRCGEHHTLTAAAAVCAWS